MVSPYPQYPQSAPYGPGSLAPPPPPDAIRQATRLIFAGAALAVVYGVVDGLTAHSSVFYTYSSTQSGTTVHQANYLVSGIVSGIVQCLLWLWMAWKTNSGRNWARVLSSVFFGFMCLGLLSAALNASSHDDAIFALLISLIEWGVGLAALILLWRPESGQFFAAARQAKFATAFSPSYPGAATPGVQAPGFPPSPQYGQPPQYGQAPQYGQPSEDGGPQQPSD
jgi:hypothetical protein